MENIKLVKAGKKPTKVGTITIDVYEDSFEVKATDKIDMFTVWMIAEGIKDYLENLAETLDKPPTTMLQ